MKESTKELLSSLIAGVFFCGAVIVINREVEMPLVQRLCDGCFVAAVMLMGTAGLRYANKQGTFDMMAFGMRSVFFTAFPSARPVDERVNEDYVAYSERKRVGRKSPKMQLLAGTIYLAVSVVLLLVYSLLAG
jgi:hypothetical protein